MALDKEAFESLLARAEEQAGRAVSENDPIHYRDAFESSLKALRMLADESSGWREAVARATEEYSGSEGI
ncbi:hypothetical protein [Stutzerimonas tarimensis]|uniref:Terminase small subunit n=1 Tax=Stutzerimonas tarimensis TaxID=1507735 RepID=A0ABV7T5W8_9GAMM